MELKIQLLKNRIHLLTERGPHNIRIVNKLQRQLRKMEQSF